MSFLQEKMELVLNPLPVQRLGESDYCVRGRDSVMCAVCKKDRAIDPVHDCKQRATLIVVEILGQLPDEAVELVPLELVRAPAELKEVRDP
jgi:hypothetical protein